MTIEEARANIGRAVAYQAYWAVPEEHGIIQRVGELVMVRYGTDEGCKATHACDLRLLS